MQELFIPLRFPGLNEYTKALSNNRYTGGAMKKEWTDTVHQYATARKLGHFTEPITLEFHWYEPNYKRDQDNVSFAKKFILDGLKNAGVITDDSYRWVKGFSDEFYYEGKKAGVMIIMKEVADVRECARVASVL